MVDLSVGRRRMQTSLVFFLLLPIFPLSAAFLSQPRSASSSPLSSSCTSRRASPSHRLSSPLYLFNNDGRSTEEIEEEARLKILESRRYQIRSVLKAAESVRNTRLERNWVPELDPETGKPIQSDGKAAVTLTAFVVAAGAIALRLGGRAALVSAVGLDFANDNPELQKNLDQILTTTDSMDLLTKLGLFTLAWTGVKVLCFDAGGVVLALSSGILFGGVIQGALISAAAATFGSSIAFAAAKLDTPVRKKALEVLDEYPSLRGIEKVVAQDGFKAILTLRLAPILPIPIGLYNYVYGVTNVPYLDFAAGIFVGSLKPYLLDSYLGFFSKEVIEGTNSGGSLQDFLLLGALGFSVLIGVFASQLASETWDSVLEEVEAEKKAKMGLEDEDVDEDDKVSRELFGFELPQFVVDFQIALKRAEERVADLIDSEIEAKVWNYTKAEGGPPPSIDPARWEGSPEITEANQSIDFGAATCEGLVLSPLMFTAFAKLADPFYKEEDDTDLKERRSKREKELRKDAMKAKKALLSRVDSLRSKVKERMALLDERLQ